MPLVWRRHRPLLVLLAVMVCIAPYHALENNHAAPLFATMVVLYTLAATGTVRRTLLTGAAVLGVTLILNALTNPDGTVEILRISGWVFAFLFCGIDVRYYRQYVAAIVERAERAERTREEEARRRVAEERLRIARDLHDLLAHSITLIGVQTSVAAHVLAADPERLNREAIAKSLDDIAGTCRTARGELRTTLELLREQGAVGEARGPLPGIDGVPDLVEAARLAGARVASEVRVREAPPAVGAAAYRIVQEALTNVVRHAGPEPAVRVELYEEQGALLVSVTDDGRRPPTAPPRPAPATASSACGSGPAAWVAHSTPDRATRGFPGERRTACRERPGRREMIRVLLADDQTLVREAFAMLVESAPDMEVVGQAATGREAAELARGTRADLVVMDIRMPDLDGIEATRLIAADEDLAEVRVLVLTTYDTDENIVDALRAGASDSWSRTPARPNSSTPSARWPRGRRSCRRGRPHG